MSPSSCAAPILSLACIPSATHLCRQCYGESPAWSLIWSCITKPFSITFRLSMQGNHASLLASPAQPSHVGCKAMLGFIRHKLGFHWSSTQTVGCLLCADEHASIRLKYMFGNREWSTVETRADGMRSATRLEGKLGCTSLMWCGIPCLSILCCPGQGLCNSKTADFDIASQGLSVLLSAGIWLLLQRHAACPFTGCCFGLQPPGCFWV